MNLELSRFDRQELMRDVCKDFSQFIKYAWHTVDPGMTFVPGWHIDAMADHLTACSTGEIRRLLINIPPGFSKSTAVSVMFLPWLWGPAGKPSVRFIGASHEQTLSTRDNRRSRMIIDSEWYQEHWPTPLVGDQNEKTYFENKMVGWRQSCAVKSMTGKRGDFVTWDDPLSPEKAYSDADRNTANRIFTETLPTRLNDQKRSAIIVVMQRLHEDDVSGHILTNELDYDHLLIPMEYEPDRAKTTSIGWRDPRSEEGELADPERFPKKEVEQLKKALGEFATAGQLQQRPYPRGGLLFKRDDFRVIKPDEVPNGIRWVRGWDIASSMDEGTPYTAGVKLGEHWVGGQRQFVVAHSERFRGKPVDVERRMLMTAQADGRQVKGSIPQDPGAAGKAWAVYLVGQLAGYSYRFSVESGDKVTRAEPFAAQVSAGNVSVVEGPWTKAYLDEIESFPAGKYADQTDATSRAFSELVMGAPTAVVGKQK